MNEITILYIYWLWQELFVQISQLHNATEEKLKTKQYHAIPYIYTVSIKTMNGIDDACGRNIPDSDEWEIINKKPINKSPGWG